MGARTLKQVLESKLFIGIFSDLLSFGGQNDVREVEFCGRGVAGPHRK
jgi:hypothetical protein